MRVRALGALDVERDGVVETVRGPQVRRLLAVLVAHRGRRVGPDRLVDALWPDGAAPDGAARSVLTYVSRLRAAVGSDVIATDGNGYVFDNTVHACDLDEFVATLTAAAAMLPDTAIERLDAALALWRGDPFAEFASEWWALTEAARLREAHVVAREDRAAALLALGRAREAVADLEGLCLDEPLRERPVMLLMRALQATGRQVDALRRGRAFRSGLAELSGLEPSAAFAAVEQAVASGIQAGADAGTLRGYVIHEVVGEGSFGRVYAATQPGTNRRVAVKVVKPGLADSVEFIRRFEAEAQLVAGLEHPHVVPLYDYWREPGGAYLVMRWLGGGSAFDALVTDGAWSLGRVSRLVEEVGGALIAAHATGVTHGDVKPANVLLDDDGHTYLADFGIARHSGVPPADDVRDFGRMLWQLLTGTTAASAPDLALSRGAGAGASPQSGVDAVISRAVTGGFDSLAEVVLAWRAAVGRPEGVLSPIDSGGRRAIDSARRHAAVQLARITVAGTNPYKGLRSFEEADAEGFQGRDELVDALVVAVDTLRLVAVVGSSGSGKSSLVRAGLVPRLRAGGAAVATMVPGADASAAMRHALRELVAADAADATLPAMMGHVAARVGRVVLVVDQFEECWTRQDPDTRRAFLALLAHVVGDSTLDARVVVTVRADLLDRPLDDAELGAAVGSGTFAVSAMSAAQLSAAIAVPAERCAVEFDDGVVAQLVADSITRPGSLPLLQFCLAELFDRRVDGRITNVALNAVGGVPGAVGQAAERVYAALDADSKSATRELFGRLVVATPGTPDTRRRARVSELSPHARAAAAHFVDARLLVADRDTMTREPTIEVAHEALFTRWPRLADWLDDDRRWLLQLQHLADTASAWDASGRSEAELYRGARLDAAVAAIDGEGRTVSGVEREFVDAAVARRDADANAARRSTRRLRRAFVGVAAALVLALVATTVAVWQRRTADSAADSARRAAAAAAQSARDAEIEVLVGRSESLRSTQRDTAALLAVEAFRLADTARTRSALFGTFTDGTVPLDTHRLASPSPAGIVFADGVTALVVLDGRLRRYDLDTGAVGDPWPLPAGRVDTAPALAVSADGRSVAAFTWDDDAGSAFSGAIFDVASGEVVARIGTHEGHVTSAAFAADGATVAVSVGADGDVVLFDVHGGAIVAEARGLAPPAVRSPTEPHVAALADGGFVIGGDRGVVRVLDDRTLEVRRRLVVPRSVTTEVRPLADGTAIGAGPDGVIRFSLVDGDTVWSQIEQDNSCQRVVVVEARTSLYCSDFFGRLVERELAGGTVVRQLHGQNGPAGGLWSATNGTELVSFGANEPVVRRWRLDGSGPITRVVAPGYQAGYLSPDGLHLTAERAPDRNLPAASSTDNVVVDLLTGEITHLPGLSTATWIDNDTIGAGAVTAAGLQVVRYDLAAGTVTADGYIFDQNPTYILIDPGHHDVLMTDVGADGGAEVWPISTSDLQRREPTITVDNYRFQAIDAHGERIAVVADGSLVVYDGHTGAELVRRDDPSLSSVYYTAADELFAATLSGELTLLDDDLRPVRTYGASLGHIQELYGTRDGRTIIVQGGDRRVSVFDVATAVRIGGPIAIPAVQETPATLAIDADVMALGGGADDGIAVWDLDPEHWVDAACALAGRELTQQEWSSAVGDLDRYHELCA